MKTTVPTAFELYFAGGPTEDEDERQTREDLFFHSIRLPNGTHKSTGHRRLDDLNDFVMELLPPQRPLEIMDVAVSSGVSTAEWLVALERAGVDCRMLAGDAVVSASLISFGPRLRALADKDGHLLQLDLGGQAIRLPPPRRRDRVLYAPFTLLMKAASRLFDLAAPAGAPPQRRLGITCSSLKLVSPSLERLPRLRTVEDDILLSTGYTRRFHVLRAANILNLAYFDVPTLERMLLNLRGRLIPGGMLIVCRTNATGVNNATVFTLGKDGRLNITAHLNDGSEIADVVLRLPPDVSAGASG